MPSSPFGAAARGKLLRQHFNEAGSITPANAWMFIYRELLWIDGSTGLAHLYESDKAQPGHTWYGRTTIFTDMICERFGHISHEELKEQIDKLFRACLEQLIKSKDVGSLGLPVGNVCSLASFYRVRTPSNERAS